MAEIIPFRLKSDCVDALGDIDLLTAVDVAIRDLSDILERWGEETSRLQAEACHEMLVQAFDAAR